MPERGISMFRLKYSWPYLVVFASIILLVLYSIASARKNIEKNFTYYKTINVAGRQRMLSQKIVKEYYKALAGENIEQQWAQDLETWNENHLMLLHGENGLSIHGKDHPAIINSFNALTPVQQSLYNNIKLAQHNTHDSNLLKKIEADEANFLYQMDNIVHDLENNAKQDLDASETNLIRVLVGCGVTLFLVIIFFVYPYHKKLVMAYKLRRQQYYEAEEQKKEIAILNRTHELTLSGINAGVWDWDIPTGKEKWSEHFYRILGYEPGEIPATYDTFLNVLVHPDDREKVSKAISEHLEHHKPYKIEIRMLNKNNNYRWYEASGQAMWDESGIPVRMSGSIIDRHERVIYRNQLLYSEFLLEETGKIAKVAGWELNTETDEMAWSKTMYNILEATPGDVKVLNKGVNRYPKEYHALINKITTNARKKGQSFDVELEVITEKGNRKWVRSIGVPVKDNNGHVVKLRGIYQDITLQKNRERELLAIKDKLHDANATKDKLLSIVAHDIRGPIINIKGLIELKKDGAIEQDEFMEYMDRVGINIDYLLAEMDNILRWAQSQMGGLTVNRDKIDVNDIVIAVTGMYQSVAASKHIAISYNNTEPIFAFADYNHVHLVVRNLVNNAVKFTPIGGKINVGISKQQGEVYISVQDSGIGMDAIALKKVFERKDVLTTTGTEGEKGTGLGIGLCIEVAEQNGGRLEAKSEPGKGSVFTLVLPASV